MACFPLESHHLMTQYKTFPPGAELSIRLYSRVPYFAYHRQDDFVIVGFYFLSGRGCTSGAYEVLGKETKRIFGGHFDHIHDEAGASALVEFDSSHGNAKLDKTLLEELRSSLRGRLPSP